MGAGLQRYSAQCDHWAESARAGAGASNLRGATGGGRWCVTWWSTPYRTAHGLSLTDLIRVTVAGLGDRVAIEDLYGRTLTGKSLGWSSLTIASGGVCRTLPLVRCSAAGCAPTSRRVTGAGGYG